MSTSPMSDATYDVTGVGNAIVDVLAPVDEAFLTAQAITKDAMTLIDQDRAEALYAAMPQGEEASGGSAANTVAGLASLGGKARYLGKVADDKLGDVFADDIRAIGVDFDTPRLSNGPSTARCLILVTPDAARSMNTFLGASALFSRTDIDETAIRDSQFTYLEGYLFDRDEAKAAFIHAAEVAKAAGRRVALTLSDTFCVDRHRASFRQLVDNHVDVVFANESELLSLYETTDFDAAVSQFRTETELGFVTRSAKGAVVISADTATPISPAPVDGEVMDTTGAGDQFAAGVLFGLARGKAPADAAAIGAIAASEVISHFGARPATSLAELITAHA